MQVPDPTKINILHFMFYGRRHLKLEMPRFIFIQVTQIPDISSLSNLFLKENWAFVKVNVTPVFTKKFMDTSTLLSVG